MDRFFDEFKKYLNICYFSTVILIMMSIVIVYVAKEDNIYSWDFAAYHAQFKNLGQALVQTGNFFDVLSASVRSYHYNFSAVVMTMPFYILFGETRVSYIASLFFVYVIPLCLLIYAWLVNRQELNNYSLSIQTVLIVTCSIFIFFYPPFWGNTLRGYTDVAALLPLFIAFFLILKFDLKRISVQNMFLLGVLLYVSFIFRRWFLLSTCSFFIASFFSSMLNLGRMWKIEFRNIVINLSIAGSVFILLAFIFQYDLMVDFICNNYKYMYEGYKKSFVENLRTFLYSIHFVYLILSMSFFVYCFVSKVLTRELVFIATYIVSNFFLMANMAGFAMQHILPISLFVLITALLFVLQLYRHAPIAAALLSLVGAFFVISNFGHTFFKVDQESSIDKFSQVFVIRPLKHSNYPEFIRLENDLVQLVKNNAPGVAVFSSNGSLNSAIFNDRESIAKLRPIYGTDVDKRDGISVHALSAKYAVVAMPVQYHLPQDEQFVVSVPATKIFKAEGIGAAYTVISGPYNFGGGVSVFIYEKQRPFTTNEIRDFIDSFPTDNYKWNNAIGITDLMILSGNIVLGDVWGCFNKNGKNSYIAHPGVNKPTSVTFGRVYTNSVEIVASIPSEAATGVCGKAGGDVNVGFITDEGSVVENLTAGNSIKYIVPSSDRPFTVLFDSNGDSGCDAVTVKFNITNE